MSLWAIGLVRKILCEYDAELLPNEEGNQGNKKRVHSVLNGNVKNAIGCGNVKWTDAL